MDRGQPLVGQVLARRYRVEALIGRGGMAEVYRGFDDRLARPVALKVLKESYEGDQGVRRRFGEEARSAAMLSHPNVVGVYDAGDEGGRAFIVMELVPGDTLASRIASGSLDEAFVRRVGGEVLDALAAAHAHGLLHRDIKPANVLLTTEGVAKVADFGIAKALDRPADTEDSTAVSVVLGTPGYLAPERAQGNPASVASDIWSAGVLLYESLAGRKPFEGSSPVAVALAAIEGRYVPVTEFRPDVAPDLAAVIDKALQTDPAGRFASAEEMARYVRAPSQEGNAAPALADPDATRMLAVPTRTMAIQQSLGPAAAVAAGGGAIAGGDFGGGSGEGPAFPPGRRRRMPAVLVAALIVLVAATVALLIFAAAHKNSPPATTTSTTTTSTKPTTSSAPTTSTTTSTTSTT
ncbi:MAG TPA: serine/threonine-protein kinase, partial [Acidimicrobiales bacterium]|nr:serine/threonine-protein kinase [Acidimicrobiales bacterium]